MKPSLSKLQKFFRLEAQRNYDNRAVFGGLQRSLQNWDAEARADGLGEDLVNCITSKLRNYEKLMPRERGKTLIDIWLRIERETGIRSKGQRSRTKPAARKPASKSPSPPGPLSNKAGEGGIPDKGEAKKQTKIKEKRTSVSFRPHAEGESAALEAPTTVLNGVGPVNAERLEKLGIFTLRDMLYHFPRRYDDYSQQVRIRDLRYGMEVTVIGEVKRISKRQGKGRRFMTEAIVQDESGALRVNWFNQPWMIRNLDIGNQIVLSGKGDQYLGRLTMNNPEWDLLDKEQLHTNRIVPVYPLTADLGQRWLRGLMNRVVTHWAPRIPDPLPTSVIESANLEPLSEALLQAHFPDSQEEIQAARQRLAFDELFLLHLAVLQQKQVWQGQAAQRFDAPQDWLDAEIARLPYQLTGAQKRALADLLKDLDSGRPMNRLLQGDVGSGKTVVAALCMAAVTRTGAQAALMAPTSILAEQHFASLRTLMVGQGGLQPDELRLIIGSTPEPEKVEIRAGLQDGSIKVVVGTHTLIEDPILFSQLELVVIDEQHRFGVGQRAALRAKGTNPHLLVMTATPIPRSLSLTIYGDLDLSIIDEMPPGRQEVATHLLLPRERERAYKLIRREVEAGRQAFIIYPLIEEGETSEAKAAVDEQKRLKKEVFPNLKVELLHGRLGAEEKDKAMAAFRDGKAQVMVSTTVIEVGLDIPNATVMLVEGANRFGLAQLHQLRGRVGRGAEKSYCILIPDHEDAAENERLQALLETNDGFILAEKDLEQRGPGQFLGRQQSGFLDFRLASLSDARLIDKARRHAEQLLAVDPALSQPEHRELAAAVKNYLSDGKGDLS
ncbi:MAG: ATP-dependent DNA helicase RecG [Chloroflexi bacterium]|nr:ATP-dependent DNA helicase RecG [Chloroflexota bacterium]